MSQIGSRMYRKDAGYEYSSSRIYLAKINEDGTVHFIRGSKGGWSRDQYLECDNLQDGEYYLIAEIDWNESTEHRSFTVNCYAQFEVDFSDSLDDATKNHVLRMIAISLAERGGDDVKVEPNDEEPAIVKSTINTDFGYMMVVIKNDA